MEQKRHMDSWQGVTLGMWVDNVLKIHPKTEWVKKKATVLIDQRSKAKIPDLIITWHYKEVDIVLERATVETAFGPVTVYAVQKIILKDVSDEHNGKYSKHKSKSRRQKRRKKRL